MPYLLSFRVVQKVHYQNVQLQHRKSNMEPKPRHPLLQVPCQFSDNISATQGGEVLRELQLFWRILHGVSHLLRLHRHAGPPTRSAGSTSQTASRPGEHVGRLRSANGRGPRRATAWPQKKEVWPNLEGFGSRVSRQIERMHIRLATTSRKHDNIKKSVCVDHNHCQ